MYQMLFEKVVFPFFNILNAQKFLSFRVDLQNKEPIHNHK